MRKRLPNNILSMIESVRNTASKITVACGDMDVGKADLADSVSGHIAELNESWAALRGCLVADSSATLRDMRRLTLGARQRIALDNAMSMAAMQGLSLFIRDWTWSRLSGLLVSVGASQNTVADLYAIFSQMEGSPSLSSHEGL